jgi:protein-L-isoaspartate(D-aspartate) O-methyltransferase
MRAVWGFADAVSRRCGRTNYGDHGESPVKSLSEKHFAVLRRHMVEVVEIQVDLMSEELERAALDERVLTAMRRVPRHLFVPEQLAALAYQDTPLPIGFDKTISQPFINAVMTDLLELEPDDVVLEIGTGLGYQASILAQIVSQVWSVEVVEEFVGQAEPRLHELGYTRVGIRVGDGSRGWVEHAPFDKIIVTAAAERPPPALLDQLKPGGRIVMPMGGADAQELTIVDKHADGQIRIRQLIPVRFTRLETVI